MKNPDAHVYEIRPRKDHRGVDPISDALPFGRLIQMQPTTQSATRNSTASQDAVIRVYDEAGNVIETHEHKGSRRGQDKSRHADEA